MRDSLVEGPLTYFIGKMGESPYSGSLGNFGQPKPDLFEKQGTLCLANDRFWPKADCQKLAFAQIERPVYTGDLNRSTQHSIL